MLNLDGKGRLAIPTRYRDRLRECCDAQLVITIDPDRCLQIYPMPEWQAFEQTLQKFPKFNSKVRRIKRLLVGHATDVEMDGQGRVVLPPPLREFAGLDKRVVLIGQQEKFELWDEDRWNRNRDLWLEGADEDGLELSPEIEALSI